MMEMLKGIKVLSFTHFLQGPSAVQMLADLGADVIKIERPEGAYERNWSGMDTFPNGVSVFFMLANRNQRSLALNLRSAEGKEIALRMIGEADVIVENYRPDAMKRLGLGYEDVKKMNPRVIYCSCSGFGPDGPYKDKPGQDLLLQSLGGLMYLTGQKSAPPTPVGTAVVDQHAAVCSAFGVMTALFNRERTGEGCKVDMCLLNSAMDLQMESMAYYLNAGYMWEKSDTGLASRFHQAPYGVYKTRDGFLTVSNTPVEKLADILHSEPLTRYNSADQMKKGPREEIDQIFADIMTTRTTQEWKDFFDRHQIWYAPVNDYDDLVKDPQVNWNKMILTYHHPDAGQVRFVNSPVRYNGEAPAFRMPPPRVGEQSEDILKEYGYSDREIKDFEEKKIVRSNKRS